MEVSQARSTRKTARTLDDAQRLTVHVAGHVGLKQSLTPEGFLFCTDVPVARVGEMLYAGTELPLEPGRDGLIRVSRGAAELFDPVFLSSLNGKPVVDLTSSDQDSSRGDHPEDDVTPENWNDLACGMMLNARPGQPPYNDCVIADLLITNKAAIESIRKGVRGVSLGYDAEYTQTAPGRALQRPVVANHLALTKTPRCGPVCSIGDSSMSKALRTTTALSRDSFLNRLRKAFLTKDADQFEQALGEAEGALSEGATSQPEAGGNGAVHVHVYGGEKPAGAEGGAATAAETNDEDEGAGGQKQEDDKFAALMSKLDEFGARLTKLEGGATADADGDPDTDGEGAEGDKDEDGDDEATADNDGSSGSAASNSAGSGGGMSSTTPRTGDSRALMTSFRDVIARAEIIAPGLKVGTFDAAAPRAKTVDAMCGIRRKALVQYGTTDDGRAVLKTLDCGDVSKMGCDAVAIAFNAATSRQRETNNQRTYRARDSYRPAERKGPPTPAEMNARHREVYGKK